MTAPFGAGDLLNERYRIVGVGEVGQFGQTYLARDSQRANALCVVKEFLPTEIPRDRLNDLYTQVTKLTAVFSRLQHPQLPRFQNWERSDDRFFWVQAYVEGQSFGLLLDDRRQQGQSFTESAVVIFLHQVAGVLHFLHSQTVIHRNLSLDSVIARPADGLPILVSFGLVRELVQHYHLHAIAPDALAQREVYLAPEQRDTGLIYPNSDLYSLAVCAIALLAGKDPNECYNREMRYLDWEAWVTISPLLRQILRQMLHPDPTRRFIAAAQVIQALQPLHQAALFSPPLSPLHPPLQPQPAAMAMGGASIEVPVPPVRSRSEPLRRRTRAGDRWATLALIASFALLIGVTVWRLLSWIQAPQTTPTKTTPANPTKSPTLKSTPSLMPPPPPTTTPKSVPSADLKSRANKAGLDAGFVGEITDEVFDRQYPTARSQGLTSAQQDEWLKLAESMVDRLGQLTPETRRKLGTYKRVDYERWLLDLNEPGKRSKELDELADARFYKLFPELQGQSLNRNTLGQVWFAIAQEKLPEAKAAKRPAK